MGLLEAQQGELAKHQEILINSIYKGSITLRKKVIQALLNNKIFFLFNSLKEENWKSLIDKNISKLVNILNSKRQTFNNTRVKNKLTFDQKQYPKLCFLLMGCFDYNPKDCEITVPVNYFDNSFDSKVENQPIHKYFRKKLCEAI